MTENAVTKMEPREIAPAITPMQMLQIAVEQGADLDKLSKLMDLQERWEATQARKAFVVALNAFKENPPTVSKNKRAGFGTGEKRTEYEYVTLDVAAAAIGAALSQHGLSHRWEVEQLDGGMIRVTCILTHEQGHSERVSMQAGADQSGSKNNIQAVGSTVTYLERYTLLAATGLAAKGQDDDATDGAARLITADQKTTLIDLMKETGADTAKFLAFLNVPSIDDLAASRFNEAKTALEAKRKQKGK
jgi:hypothetical protein